MPGSDESDEFLSVELVDEVDPDDPVASAVATAHPHPSATAVPTPSATAGPPT
ncbi:hypothetical protein ABQF17_15285 [Mycolicibacterium elephantis]|uniref:hypothetical protein n=1 Tax=Mycolicibacterium elephantis TaxID=81858 RepID=UPI0013F4F9CB|nr:hypothetical protein [Mycolicibacterium elephantis]